MNTTKKLIATGALGVAVLGGSLTLAATGIVDPAGALDRTTETTTLRKGREVRRQVAQVTADTIGITREELRSELATGKSIEQVATDNGVDPQIVIDAIVEDATVRVDRALADGRIDETRAAKIKERLPRAVTRLVAHVFEGRR